MPKNSNSLLPDYPPIIRKENWKEELDKLVEEYKTKQFIIGTNDCFIFARDCVGVMTDVYLFKQLDKNYSNAFGTKKQLIKWGLSSLEEGVSSFFDQIPMEEAKEGDIVVHRDPPIDTLGIIYNGKCLFKTVMEEQEILQKPNNIFVETTIKEKFVYYRV